MEMSAALWRKASVAWSTPPVLSTSTVYKRGSAFEIQLGCAHYSKATPLLYIDRANSN